MSEITRAILVVFVGYLLGSIPSAYIAARLRKGVDIRKVGGGNPGALNTFREIGAIEGIIVLLADIAKGAGAVFIAQASGTPQLFVLLAGAASVIGHTWPVFLRFHGGRGLATTIGVFLALFSWKMLIAIGIAIIPILITRNITFGMAIGLASLPLIVWRFGGSMTLILYSILLPLFLGLRYIPTFKEAIATRGIKGSIFEHQLGPKRK
jgi:glycerol-3-phosphate acyltransferase PlsY